MVFYLRKEEKETRAIWAWTREISYFFYVVEISVILSDIDSEYYTHGSVTTVTDYRT